jgi:hypothetical protein
MHRTRAMLVLFRQYVQDGVTQPEITRQLAAQGATITGGVVDIDEDVRRTYWKRYPGGPKSTYEDGSTNPDTLDP